MRSVRMALLEFLWDLTHMSLMLSASLSCCSPTCGRQPTQRRTAHRALRMLSGGEMQVEIGQPPLKRWQGGAPLGHRNN